MSDNWPRLKNPPVILAIMEIRFKLTPNINVSGLKRNDTHLLKKFPLRTDNFKGNINLPEPIAGLSTAQVSHKQVGYTYNNDSKTKKVVITEENLIYSIESNYPGWSNFKQECIEIVKEFDHVLNTSLVVRVSMRYINRLSLPKSDSPEEYFNTMISAREGTIEESIDTYFIKYTKRISKTKIRANVILSLEEIAQDNCSFVFDIDVLCHNTIKFNSLDLNTKLEEIREIKNDIFFKNLTSKALKQL